MSLPDGFETDVGGKGAQLSGGQVGLMGYQVCEADAPLETTDSHRSGFDQESESPASR